MDKQPNKKQFPLPAIRQTKTSLFRLIKANPNLNLDEETKKRSANAGPNNCKRPFVRSLSLRVPKNTTKANYAAVGRTKSIKEKRPTTVAFEAKALPNLIETTAESESKRKVVFHTSTPTIETTPRFCRYRRTPFRITPETTETTGLIAHLHNWLLQNNKSLHDFYNLQNIAGYDSMENKENIEPITIYRTQSWEDLNIPSKVGALTPADPNEYDLKKYACGGLRDLRKLIMEGYPFIQSEAWLDEIHDKYIAIAKEPEYWECRALIEQNRDNITGAVEYYRTAIIHGAEVNSVECSLDGLLQKFSLLNIGNDQKPIGDKKRVKILSDARNIFKTSIIQGAIQERNLKKKEVLPDVLDTPVQSRVIITQS